MEHLLSEACGILCQLIRVPKRFRGPKNRKQTWCQWMRERLGVQEPK